MSPNHQSRVSVRAFKPDPIPEALVRDILDVARSPPRAAIFAWRVIAVAGVERDAVAALAKANLPGAEDDRPSIRKSLGPLSHPPLQSRRRHVRAPRIGRDNKPARLIHLAQNFDFFGAPSPLLHHRQSDGPRSMAHLACSCKASPSPPSNARAVLHARSWARMRTPLAAHFASAITR